MARPSPLGIEVERLVHKVKRLESALVAASDRITNLEALVRGDRERAIKRDLMTDKRIDKVVEELSNPGENIGELYDKIMKEARVRARDG